MSDKRRILVVEDNSDVRRLYAIGLNQRGFEVKLAANGAEALDRIEHEEPDLVLLDIVMPIMSGWEFLQKLNPPERVRKIPVIVITGQSSSPDHLPDSCIVGWLSKPVTIEELVGSIRESFEPVTRPAERQDSKDL